MIDTHLVPNSNWGVMPVLFKMGNFNVDSYTFFVILALVAGLSVFFYESRKQKSANEKTFYILLAALFGGIIGAKLPIWIIHYKEIIASFPDITPFLSGRTIVGGLIGGTIAVMLIKKWMGITEKKGNIFAPAIALGIAIGRIGCFLRGCCYGTPTSLPWGVDFGDGILRHPTQIYESLFALAMFFYLMKAKKNNPKPGILFEGFMMAYFIFRFFIEFIRVENHIFLGLTGFQLVSICVIAYYSLKRFIR